MADDVSDRFTTKKTAPDVDSQDVDALSNQYLQESQDSISSFQFFQGPQDNQTFQQPRDGQYFQDARENQNFQDNLSQAVWNAMIENRSGFGGSAYRGHPMGCDPDESIMQGGLHGGSLDKAGAAAEAIISNRQKSDEQKQGPHSIDKYLEDQLTRDEWWKTIKPEDINQGKIGDCFFEASIASMANSERGREAIGKMIKQNEDGSVDVKFPGAPESIHVSREKVKESTNDMPWAQAMEAAFLQYNKSTSLPFPQKSGIRSFGDATNVRGVAELLTGNNNVTTDQFTMGDLNGRITVGPTSIENVEKDLIKGLDRGNIITATAAKNMLKYVGANAPGPIPEQHAYAVTGYDEQSKTVTVLNPWGHNGKKLGTKGDTIEGVTNIGDGKMEMPLEVFYKRFNDLTISDTNEAGTIVEHTADTAKDAASSYADAAVNLAKGDLAGAVKENLSGLKQTGYGMSQLTYAAGSAAWDAGDNMVDGAGNLVKKIF